MKINSDLLHTTFICRSGALSINHFYSQKLEYLPIYISPVPLLFLQQVPPKQDFTCYVSFFFNSSVIFWAMTKWSVYFHFYRWSHWFSNLFANPEGLSSKIQLRHPLFTNMILFACRYRSCERFKNIFLFVGKCTIIS